MSRMVIGAAALIGVLSLAGCAADPDLGTLEADLSVLPGVNGTTTWVTHSGAPWNTQIQIMLFVESVSEEGIVDAVRAAAPVISADDAASRHDVGLWFVEGAPADYPDSPAASSIAAAIAPSVFETLQVDGRGGRVIHISPGDIERIASAQ